MYKKTGKKLRWLYTLLAITLSLVSSVWMMGCSQQVTSVQNTVQNIVQDNVRDTEQNSERNIGNDLTENTNQGSNNNNRVDDAKSSGTNVSKDGQNAQSYDEFLASVDTLPEYTGNPYIVVNDNTPFFTETDMTTVSFENYGELDSLGRCSVAYANVGKDLMPTEKRGSIGSVKPTGWQTVKYDNVDGKYLYNRCHLIGFQLTAENANKKNLITGTRYLNVNGMLPFENMVADYIKETNNHVLYRVTPVFAGDNLVAGGVLMEAESVEDKGEGILFNVYCYNVQPGIVIDYATGDSHIE